MQKEPDTELIFTCVRDDRCGGFLITLICLDAILDLNCYMLLTDDMFNSN